MDDYAYPADRPWLRANMIASIDGAAVGADGKTGPLGGEADHTLFHHLRGLADAVLVGAGTVRDEGYGPVKDGKPLIVVSRTLDLDFDAPFFGGRTILLTVEDAPRLAEARRHAEVIVAGRSSVDFADGLQELHALGLTRLLCEGGPVVLAQIAAAGLLDELCLTVSPHLVGGSSQRILQGPPVGVELALSGVRQDGDHLFLRYARQN
ncbi:dihydrofolate reductase family protein [Actinocorallia longicatena]|uniref:Pyrimidine reductase family protein n=1 Tax=Actinocorallia longicatena TaxID=111803 RepID=A0ABP6QP56_9ACTN